MSRSTLSLCVTLTLVLFASRPCDAVTTFVRADSNSDGMVNIADVVATLGYLFSAQSVPCLETVDANSDGNLDISDAVFTLAFVFSGGGAPQAPYPDCGVAPLVFGCASSPGCVPTVQDLLAPHEFYPGPDLQRPRYGHTATTLCDGRVLIVGGSDDRLLTSIDTVEIFDQSATTVPTPASIHGAFIQTDTNGDPITLPGGGRIFHTATLLQDGNVLICGGAPNAASSEALGDAQIFDLATRQISPPSLGAIGSMVHPRFNHTAVALPDGRVVITGGQRSVQETIIDPNFPPGDPNFQMDITVFPSVESVEIYDPATQSFSLAIDSTGNAVQLGTPRGRSSHASALIAGLDQLLGTADDLIVHAGGIQTFGGVFAPTTKLPGQPGPSLPTTVEVYSPASGTLLTLPGIVLAPRANGARLLNLGEHTDTTPDGVAGVSNVLLLTGGDDDGGGTGQGSVSQSTSELLVATFAVAGGPLDGLSVQDATNVFGDMNRELVQFDPTTFSTIGRTGAGAIVLPTERTYNGNSFVGNWVVTAGGAQLTTAGGQQQQALSGLATNELQGVMLFDPFFHPGSANPTDLSSTASADNPTGVLGGWLNGDAAIPDDSLAGYADPPLSALAPLVGLNEGRVLHCVSLIPGVDGVMGTADDRVLITGGGNDWILNGGAPSTVSSEIYVQP